MQEQLSFLELPAAGEYELPAGAPVERCRSCGASIVWGKTAIGTAVPLDLAHVRRINEQRYALTHFATCPQGREWRRKRA